MAPTYLGASSSTCCVRYTNKYNTCNYVMFQLIHCCRLKITNLSLWTWSFVALVSTAWRAETIIILFFSSVVLKESVEVS